MKSKLLTVDFLKTTTRHYDNTKPVIPIIGRFSKYTPSNELSYTENSLYTYLLNTNTLLFNL